MKANRIFFSCLMTLNIGLCSCRANHEEVEDVIIELKDNSFMVGDSFSLSDVSIYLNYQTYSELVNNNELDSYNCEAKLHTVDNSIINLTFDKYTFPKEGTYELEVIYTNEKDSKNNCTGWKNIKVRDRNIPAKSLTLGSDSVSLLEECEEKLNYLVLPMDTTSTVTFESSDESVAIVSSDGVITGINEGQCIVKVKVDNFVEECLVTVSPTQTIEYAFTNNRFESSNGGWIYSEKGNNIHQCGVRIFEETTITSPISFDNITKIEIDCPTKSSVHISGIDDGEIETFIEDELVGTHVIHANEDSFCPTYKVDKKSGYVKLNIKPNTDSNADLSIKTIRITYDGGTIYPTGIQLTEDVFLPVNSQEKMKITYTPSTANFRNVEWSSSNEDILTVSRDGTISAIKEGQAEVTATAMVNGGYISNTVTVSVYKKAVESISLSDSKLTVFEKNNKTLSYEVLPSDASYKNVKFVSSNTNVATVDANGNITGVKAGECTITVVSEDDATIVSSCNIVVKEKPVLVAGQMSYLCSDYFQNAGNSSEPLSCAPSLGNTKLLVIPVWFKDSKSFISNRDNVRDDIRKVYFGTEQETGWQSVKTFYETESNGRLTLNGTVSEWYEEDNNYSYYNYDTTVERYENRTPDLVVKATDWYFNNHSDSRKNYDADGDGFLDGVILVYACPDNSELNIQNKDNLWAYTSWICDPNQCRTDNPGVNPYFWASYDFMYGSETASIRTGKSNYGGGNTDNQTIDSHTFIHEAGHIFGLEDYYDYSSKYVPAGGFSMQDYNVGGHDPFSCLSLGWADTYIPDDDCEIILKPFQSSHEVILLSPEFNSYNSPFDEYLLLELYTPTGLNKFDTDYSYGSESPRGVNATGIRLWHVDARLVKNNYPGTSNPQSTYTYPISECILMMSNTYYSSNTANMISPCGRNYANYNLLQLLRNSSTAEHQTKSYFGASNLYKDGSTFTMSSISKQFVKAGKLNSGLELGWSFDVSISGSNESAIATITLKKD